MNNDSTSSMILDALDDHIALLEKDGTISQVNAAWRRFAQENGDPILSSTGPGTNYIDVCARAARSGDQIARHILSGILAVRAGQQASFYYEYPCHSPLEQRWFLMRAVPLAPGDGRILVSHRPITTFKEAEIRSIETLEILSRAESVAHIGSWKWDFATNQVTWSDEMFRIFGLDRASFDGNLNTVIERAIHPDDQDRVRAANAHVLSAHEPAPLEYRIHQPGGEERVVYADGLIAHDADGRSVAILGSLHDRTEMKRAEAALQMDDRRLNALFELSERAYTLSESAIIQLALEHAVALTSSQIGYLHFVNPDQLTLQFFTWSLATQAHCTAIHETHYPIEQAGIWADCVRTKRPVIHNDDIDAAGWRGLPAGHAPLTRHLSVPVLDAQDNVVLVIGVGNKAQPYDDTDARQARLIADSMWKIVQRKRAEARLHLQSAALEATATPIVITDHRGVIAWVNPAYTQITGYTAAEAIGQNPRILKSGKHAQPFYTQMWDTILAGEVWKGELTNRRKSGQLYDEEQTITPVRDEDGQIAHFIAIKQDITERKQWEYEQMARTSLSATLGATTTRADMLMIILRRTCDLLMAAGVGVAVVAGDADDLLIERADGIWSSATGQRLNVTGTAICEVLASNRPLFGSMAMIGDRPGHMVGDSQLALACVSLSVSHDRLGVLLVSRERPFSATDQHMLIAIAEIAGNALHRATLHEETERHLKRMQALHRIDKTIISGIDIDTVLGIVLDELTAQLSMDAIAVLRMHHMIPALERVAARGFISRSWPQTIRLGEGDAGHVALTREMVYRSYLTAWDASESGVPQEEGFVLYFGIPLVSKGQLKGVLELFARAPFHATLDWRATLDMFASQLAIALDNADMVERLQRSHTELMHAYETTIEGWSRALDLRDKETEGHTLRVTEMTLRLAHAVGVSDGDVVHIRRGALLHDIGKMGVPDHILLKPGPLTDAEWEIMRRHPVYAYEMLAPIAFLEQALAIPYCHHERYDGQGYPRGLTGEQIPLAARIFAVVDVWDALRSDRAYRAGWPDDRVLRHIQGAAGQHFDPHVVDVFLKMMRWDTVALAN
ncbi:MAG: GAF domain-containing protein [Chloroflexales bacterium]